MMKLHGQYNMLLLSPSCNMRRICLLLLLLFCLMGFFNSITIIYAHPGDLSASPAETEAEHVSSSSRAAGGRAAGAGAGRAAAASASEAAAAEDAAAVAAADEEEDAEISLTGVGSSGVHRSSMRIHKSLIGVSFLAASLGAAVYLSLWFRGEVEQQQKTLQQLEYIQPQVERLSELIGSETAVQLCNAYKERVAAVETLKQQFLTTHNPVYIHRIRRQLKAVVSSAEETVGELQREAERAAAVLDEQHPTTDTSSWVSIQPTFISLTSRDLKDSIFELLKFAEQQYINSINNITKRRENIQSLPKLTNIIYNNNNINILNTLIDELLHLQTEYDEVEQCIELFDGGLSIAESAVREKVLNTAGVYVQQLKNEYELINSICCIVKESIHNATPKTRILLNNILDSKKEVARKIDELNAVYTGMQFLEDVEDVIAAETRAAATAATIRKNIHSLLKQFKQIEYVLGCCDEGKQQQSIQLLQQKAVEAIHSMQRIQHELQTTVKRIQGEFTELITTLPPSINEVYGERIAVSLMEEMNELIIIIDNIINASKKENEFVIKSKTQKTTSRYTRNIFQALTKATESMHALSNLKYKFLLYKLVETDVVMCSDAAFAATHTPQQQQQQQQQEQQQQKQEKGQQQDEQQEQQQGELQEEQQQQLQLLQQLLQKFHAAGRRARDAARLSDFVRSSADMHKAALQLSHQLLAARYLAKGVAADKGNQELQQQQQQQQQQESDTGAAAATGDGRGLAASLRKPVDEKAAAAAAAAVIDAASAVAAEAAAAAAAAERYHSYGPADTVAAADVGTQTETAAERARQQQREMQQQQQLRQQQLQQQQQQQMQKQKQEEELEEETDEGVEDDEDEEEEEEMLREEMQRLEDELADDNEQQPQ